MKREEFVNLIYSNFDKITLEKLLEDLNIGNLETDSYFSIIKDEEVYIINRITGEMISWYKTYHIGRCLNLRCDNVVKFIKLLSEEYKDIDNQNKS